MSHLRLVPPYRPTLLDRIVAASQSRRVRVVAWVGSVLVAFMLAFLLLE